MAGAIDIMVVQQPDGSLKCSPFYGEAPALLLRLLAITRCDADMPLLPTAAGVLPLCRCHARLSSSAYACAVSSTAVLTWRLPLLILLMPPVVRFGKYTPMRSKDKRVQILINGELSMSPQAPGRSHGQHISTSSCGPLPLSGGCDGSTAGMANCAVSEHLQGDAK
jgi:hypothetical protein